MNQFKCKFFSKQFYAICLREIKKNHQNYLANVRFLKFMQKMRLKKDELLLTNYDYI